MRADKHLRDRRVVRQMTHSYKIGKKDHVYIMFQETNLSYVNAYNFSHKLLETFRMDLEVVFSPSSGFFVNTVSFMSYIYIYIYMDN